MQIARKTLVVERVAAFVQRREDAATDLREHADREPHVVAPAERERMRRAVQPPALEVEAHVAQHEAQNCPAAPRRSRRAGAGPVPARALRGAGTSAHERADVVAQQRIEPRAAHVGLELVEQPIVDVVTRRQGRGALADQPQQRREGARENA